MGIKLVAETFLYKAKYKICMFRVILPNLIFLVKPRNFFHIFSKKKNNKKNSWYWDKMCILNIWMLISANSVYPDQTAPIGSL